MAAGVPSNYLADVLTSLADLLAMIPHLEYILAWVRAVCLHHAATLAAASKAGGVTGAVSLVAAVGPPLRALSRAVAKAHEDLSSAAEGNLFALDYLCAAEGVAASSDLGDKVE